MKGVDTEFEGDVKDLEKELKHFFGLWRIRVAGC